MASISSSDSFVSSSGTIDEDEKFPLPTHRRKTNELLEACELGLQYICSRNLDEYEIVGKESETEVKKCLGQSLDSVSDSISMVIFDSPMKLPRLHIPLLDTRNESRANFILLRSEEDLVDWVEKMQRVRNSGMRGIPSVLECSTGTASLFSRDEEEGSKMPTKALQYIVTTGVGPSLCAVRSTPSKVKMKKNLSPGDAMELFIQSIELLQELHDHGWVHGDIRPGALSIKLYSKNQKQVISFSDMGLCQPWKNEKDEPLPMKMTNPSALLDSVHIEFCSVHSHLGFAHTRRDDLESLFYTIVYLVEGELPWSACAVSGARESVGMLKKSTTSSSLCNALPLALHEYLDYVRNLGFKTSPDYHKLITLCKKVRDQCESKPVNKGRELKILGQLRSNAEAAAAAMKGNEQNQHQHNKSSSGVDLGIIVEGNEAHDINGRFCGGTLSRLLYYAVYEHSLENEKHEEYAIAFLTAYRFAWTTEQFIKELIKLHQKINKKANRAERDQHGHALDQFVSLWMRILYQEELGSNSSALNLILHFAEHHVGKDVQNQVKLAAIRANMVKEKEIEFHALSTIRLEEYSSLEVAQQLTLVDAMLYQKVRIREFVHQAWLKDPRKAKQLTALAARFNQVSFWVATELLSEDSRSGRTRLIKRFISIAQKLRQLRNYNSLVAVIAGLNHSSVHRLKSCWQRLPEKYALLFEELEELVSPRRNFSTYRKEFSQVESPKIPYISIYLRGILNTDESLPLYFQKNITNGDKLISLGSQIMNLLTHQSQIQTYWHQFSPRSPLIEYLAMVSHWDEERLHTQSQKIQPLAGSLALQLNLGKKDDTQAASNMHSSPRSEPSSTRSTDSYESSSEEQLTPHSVRFSARQQPRDQVSAEKMALTSHSASELGSQTQTTVIERRDGVETWTESRVRRWIWRQTDVAVEARRALSSRAMHGSELAKLDHTSLRKLGVRQVEERKRILELLHLALRINNGKRVSGGKMRLHSGPTPLCGSTGHSHKNQNHAERNSAQLARKSGSAPIHLGKSAPQAAGKKSSSMVLVNTGMLGSSSPTSPLSRSPSRTPPENSTRRKTRRHSVASSHARACRSASVDYAFSNADLGTRPRSRERSAIGHSSKHRSSSGGRRHHSRGPGDSTQAIRRHQLSRAGGSDLDGSGIANALVSGGMKLRKKVRKSKRRSISSSHAVRKSGKGSGLSFSESKLASGRRSMEGSGGDQATSSDSDPNFFLAGSAPGPTLATGFVSHAQEEERATTSSQESDLSPQRTSTIHGIVVKAEILEKEQGGGYLPYAAKKWNRGHIRSWFYACGFERLISDDRSPLAKIRSLPELFKMGDRALRKKGVTDEKERAQLVSAILLLSNAWSTGDKYIKLCALLQCLPPNFAHWTPEAVCVWLQTQGQYSDHVGERILAAGLGGSQLITLNATELEELSLLQVLQLQRTVKLHGASCIS